MKYFLDTEFHAYHKQSRLLGINIGKPIPTMDLKQQMDERTYSVREIGEPHEQALNWMKEHPDYPKQKNEHNALADAKWNMALYDFLLSF